MNLSPMRPFESSLTDEENEAYLLDERQNTLPNPEVDFTREELIIIRQNLWDGIERLTAELKRLEDKISDYKIVLKLKNNALKYYADTCSTCYGTGTVPVGALWGEIKRHTCEKSGGARNALEIGNHLTA